MPFNDGMNLSETVAIHFITTSKIACTHLISHKFACVHLFGWHTPTLCVYSLKASELPADQTVVVLKPFLGMYNFCGKLW